MVRDGARLDGDSAGWEHGDVCACGMNYPITLHHMWQDLFSGGEWRAMNGTSPP